MAHKDLLLAQRIARGEKRAFEAFLDAYGSRVHRLVRRNVANPTDAEDVTQEIFCDIHRSIHQYRGEASLSTWTYRVALNHCWRYRQRKHPESISLEEERFDMPTEDWESNPEKAAENSELSVQVQTALDQLSPSLHDVVVLCELHGMTYQECATTLQIPVGTVKSRMHHAFRRLRTLLGGYVFSNIEKSEPVQEGQK